MRTATFVLILLLTATQDLSAQGSFAGGSERCGALSGRTQQDLDKARTFCATLPEHTAEGAYVAGSTLIVRVTRPVADQIRGDRLAAEQVILAWLADWRRHSDLQPVTLTVRWGDIRLARGEATRSGTDQVIFP